MATRWLAARRPCHRTSLPAQPAGVRSLLFDRKLVSRLHRLLRRLRDGKKLYAIVAQVGRRKPILKKAQANQRERTIPTPSVRLRSGSAPPCESRFSPTTIRN